MSMVVALVGIMPLVQDSPVQQRDGRHEDEAEQAAGQRRGKQGRYLYLRVVAVDEEAQPARAAGGVAHHVFAEDRADRRQRRSNAQAREVIRHR